MKKLILLAAVALLSLGASAQGFKFNAEPAKSNVKNVKIANPDFLKGAKAVTPKGTLTRTGEVPEGEKREFFLNRQDAVFYYTDLYQGSLFPHITKETLIFGNDGKVYIPNMMYASQFEGTTYIEGTLNADGSQITIQPNQVVGTTPVETSPGVTTDIDVYISAINSMGQPLSTPITLYVDKSTGVIYNMDENFTLGLLATVGTQTQMITYSAYFNYYPINNSDLFQAPLTREATATETTQSNQAPHTTKYSVEDYNVAIGGRFIKGLLPAYPNSWIMGVYQNNSNNITIGTQVLNDGILLYVNDSEFINMNNKSLFTAGMLEDTYTQASGSTITDIYYYSGDDLNPAGSYNTATYQNIALGTPIASGINNVETSTDKEAVSVEYYDLSGRRISAAEKGVSIKVEKYADGTSKAVKVMK